MPHQEDLHDYSTGVQPGVKRANGYNAKNVASKRELSCHQKLKPHSWHI